MASHEHKTTAGIPGSEETLPPGAIIGGIPVPGPLPEEHEEYRSGVLVLIGGMPVEAEVSFGIEETRSAAGSGEEEHASG
jgi:hypothetical protein